MVEEKTNTKTKNSQLILPYRYPEDMAIVNYMIKDKRYLLSSGIKVWKDAEKLQICPGRTYQSMKERFRKVISKNLRHYKVDENVADLITQFMRARPKGKSVIRDKLSDK